MKQNFKNGRMAISPNPRKTIFLTLATFLMVAYSSPIAAQQKPSKIQEAVNSIKEAYYCQDADYHTDGQRTVWVKSYTRWTPDDFENIKKQSPHILKFLNEAIEHNRLDVLEQLLPDYYQYNGGVKAFAADIIRNQPLAQNPPSKKLHR